jgi:hypothetical protein
VRDAGRCIPGASARPGRPDEHCGTARRACKGRWTPAHRWRDTCIDRLPAPECSPRPTRPAQTELLAAAPTAVPGPAPRLPVHDRQPAQSRPVFSGSVCQTCHPPGDPTYNSRARLSSVFQSSEAESQHDRPDPRGRVRGAPSSASRRSSLRRRPALNASGRQVPANNAAFSDSGLEGATGPGQLLIHARSGSLSAEVDPLHHSISIGDCRRLLREGNNTCPCLIGNIGKSSHGRGPEWPSGECVDHQGCANSRPHIGFGLFGAAYRDLDLLE